MTQMFDFAKHGCPSRQGSVRMQAALCSVRGRTFSPCCFALRQRYVYEYNSGLQAQGVVHSSATWAISEPGSGAVLLDPNSLSADGTVSLATRSFSRCGTLCAYGLSASGSDWVTGRVLRVAPADGAVTHLPDVVERAKFTSFAWTADGAGFFYARYPDDVAGAASVRAPYWLSRPACAC